MHKLDSLVFHHLLKTAGTFFYYLLRNQFPSDAVCPGFNDASITRFRSLSSDYRFFSGHFSYSYLAQEFQSSDWVTFLREPVARVISLYRNYSNLTRIQERWKETTAFSSEEIDDALAWVAQASLGEFVTSERRLIKGSSRNYMVRNLCSRGTDPSLMEPGVYSQAIVDEALENLFSKFTFFGITEMMRQSLHLFCHHYGIFPVDSNEMARHNVSREDQTTSGHDKEFIRQCNLMDIELYRRASEEFIARYESLITRLMVGNHIIQQARSGAECYVNGFTNQKVSIDMIKPSAHGFHYLEQDGLGRYFRWTGAMNVLRLYFMPSVDVRNITQRILRMDVINIAGAAVMDGLSICCNGVEADKITNTMQGDRFHCEATFTDKTESDDLFDTIIITTPQCLLGEGGHSRSLGMAVIDISVEYS